MEKVREVKLAFDTEFTGLTKDCDLISIGVVPMNDAKEFCEFYGELTDWERDKISEDNMKWMVDNVISNLTMPTFLLKGTQTTTVRKGNMEYVLGDRKYVGEQLRTYIDSIVDNYADLYPDEKIVIQFVSDVSHYDFVLLVDLLTDGGVAFDLPKYIAPVCVDINQMLADLGSVSNIEAFDMSREQFLDNLNLVPDGSKHNALYDAKCIATIYENLTKIR